MDCTGRCSEIRAGIQSGENITRCANNSGPIWPPALLPLEGPFCESMEARHGVEWYGMHGYDLGMVHCMAHGLWWVWYGAGYIVGYDTRFGACYSEWYGARHGAVYGAVYGMV